MITKFATLYYNGDDCLTVKTARGFNRAILQFDVPEGCTVSYLTIKKSVDSSSPSIYIDRIFENGVINGGATIYPITGRHTYIVDISGSTSIKVDVKDDAATPVPLTNISLSLLQDPVDVFDSSGRTVGKDSPYYVVGQGKQVDFNIEEISSGSIAVSLQGSNDDFATTTNIGFLDVERNKYLTSSLQLTNRGKVKLYANIEGYKKVRLSFTFAGALQKAIVTSTVHQDYLEGRVIGNIGASYTNLLKGYKYFKFHFLKEGYINNTQSTAIVAECTAVPAVRVDGGTRLSLKFYDRGMNQLGYNFTAAGGGLMGTPSDGGLIVSVDNPLGDSAQISFVKGSPIPNVNQCIVPCEIACYVNEPAPETYLTKVRECTDFDIYELPSKETNRDVLNEDVLEWSDNSLTFWHCGYLGVRYDIPFDINNVAHFVEGETIKFAYLLPYGGLVHKNEGVGRLYLPSRIVVFTDNRVYHNFPARDTSTTPASDLFKFDESTIYNKFKWLPVNNSADVNNFSKYFPVLKDYDYEQFKYRVATSGYYKVEVNPDDELPEGVEPIATAIPIQVTGKYTSSDIGDVTLPDAYNRVVTYYKANGDTTYTSWKITILDPYGNNGLPSTAALQNAVKKTVGIWNRIKYSSMTKCQKYCAFGNYNQMYQEPFVMMTNDGGRTWYVHAYFAVTDFYYAQGPGSDVDLSPITNVAGAYVANSLRMCRKRFNLPTAEVKEPTTPFIIDENDKSLVTGFSVNEQGQCVVTVADNVDYDGNYPIVYFENVNAGSGWDYICNNSVTPSSGGNGIFFRVEKVSANQYILYGDTGNPNEGDMVCRHIHAVNAVECGVLISTGESYGVNPPNMFQGGFLYVIKQTENNGGGAILITYGNTNLDVVTRLTSSPLGVNRASGAFLFSDNADPTLLYVSDEAFTVGDNHKRYAALPAGRTQMLPVTPGGIYIGKLSDVDEQAKFKCVCETKGTVVGLTENKGHFAADGHENAICFSKNGFDWFIEEDSRSYVNGCDNKGNIYFGNKVAVFK